MVEDDQNVILECSSRALSSSETDGLCKEEPDPLEHYYTIKEEVDSETPYDEQYYSENTAETTKCVWLDSTTEFLLSLVEEFFPKVGKTFKLHTKKKMWQVVRSKMAEEGYTFTVAQVESKFRTLERQYNKTMRRNKQTGLKQTCPFQLKMESILRCKRGLFSKCVQEEYYSSGSNKIGVIEQDLDDLQAAGGNDALGNPNISLAQSDEESISQAPKKKPSIAATMLKEVRESRAERQAFHTKVLQYLQSKEERNERMEERAERREERDVRKLELLEKLVRMKGREGSG